MSEVIKPKQIETQIREIIKCTRDNIIIAAPQQPAGLIFDGLLNSLFLAPEDGR